MSGLDNLIKLAKLTLNTADDEQFPVMQITYLNKVADSTILLPYGMSAKGIPNDTLCLVLSIQGMEENRISIPLATTNRKKGLKDGEVVIENEATGGYLYQKEDGDLEINIPKDLLENVKNITINCDGDYSLNVTGDVDIVATGDAKVEAATALIKAGRVDLGDTGGKQVARVGDTVSGGVIQSGSNTVFAVD